MLTRCCAGLLLTALEFVTAGLGFAQRARVMAKRVAPTDKAAAVECTHCFTSEKPLPRLLLRPVTCCAGLLLMALGFAGLGYAAQRALFVAKKVAPTDEAAAVEAAKLESIIGKVVDTPLITEPSSSGRDVSRDDIRGSKAMKGDGKQNVVQNGDGHAVHGTTNSHRKPEVGSCSHTGLMAHVQLLSNISLAATSSWLLQPELSSIPF